MPARERMFSDPLPKRLFIDTNILVSYLFEFDWHHERCIRFMRALHEEDTVLLVSSLTWVEFAQVITRSAFRQRLPLTIRQRFRLQRWELRSVRELYFADLLGALDSAMAQFRWVEVDLTPEVRRRAVEYMARYALGSQDAVHLASAALAGVPDFASLDDVFRRVDGLLLWNDRLHGAGA